MVENNQIEQANKVIDECQLPDVFRSKLIIPLKVPKISALSAGWESGSVFQLTLNGLVFDINKLQKNIVGNHRGMNLFFIDRLTHEVTLSQSFDTSESEADERLFNEAISKVGSD